MKISLEKLCVFFKKARELPTDKILKRFEIFFFRKKQIDKPA